MVREMRSLLFYGLILLCFLGFSQKKNRNKEVAIPETQEDSVKLEAVLIDAEKQLILENYAKALEGFTVALGMNAQSPAIHFKIAEVLAKSGEGQKALPYGLRSIELDPENKYYRISLARIYQSIGFYIEAAKIYEALLEKFPSNEDGLYELAELYQLTGRKEDMFRTFDKIEKQLGVKEEIVREKQRIYLKEGKIDEVIAEYQKLAKAYPNETAYQFELISFLIQNKRLDEAETAIITFENEQSSTARILLLKSEVAWMKNEHEQSLTLLAEAFESRGIDFETKFQIVSNYLMAASSSNHQEQFTNLVKGLADQYPEEFRAQAFVGDMLFQGGQPEEALNYYLKAVQLKPSNYTVWQNILNVEADLNQYDSLIVHAERALEYFPNQALLYYFAGTGYLINKDYQKSVRMLDLGKKYTTDPNLLTVFYGQLGDAYNGLKQTDKSFKSYEKALENNQDNDHVLNNYSYFLSLRGEKLDKAYSMSKQLVEKYPDNPTYLDTHGWVLYIQGDYKNAHRYLKRATELDDDGTIIEHYGDVLFQMGDIESAIEQWEKASKTDQASENIQKKIADRKLYE